jgi:cysteine-rich repeat protein
MNRQQQRKETKGKAMATALKERLSKMQHQAKADAKERNRKLRNGTAVAHQRANELAETGGCGAAAKQMRVQKKALKVKLVAIQKEEAEAKAKSDAMQQSRMQADEASQQAMEKLNAIKEEAKHAAKAEEVADKLANGALNELVGAASEKKAAYALQKTFQIAVDKTSLAKKAAEHVERRDTIAAEARKARAIELQTLAALQQVKERKHKVDLQVLQNKAMHDVCAERDFKSEQSKLVVKELKAKEQLKAAEVTQKQDVLERSLLAAEVEKAKGLSANQCIRGKHREEIGKAWSQYARSPPGGGNCVCAPRSCQVSAVGLADLVCVDYTAESSVYTKKKGSELCECKGTMCLHAGTCHHTHAAGSVFEKGLSGECKCRNGCMMEQAAGTKSLKGLCTDLRNNENGFVKLGGDTTHCAPLGKARLGDGTSQKSYVYRLFDGKWALEEALEPVSPQSTEFFGSAAVFAQPLDAPVGEGLQILVGALYADSNGIYESGATYVFEKTQCGDSRKAKSENCEDGNTVDGDGCSSICVVEPGYQCSAGSANKPDKCSPEAGDGRVVGFEECDDSNLVDGDGCSSKLTVEPSWSCFGGSAVTMSTCERCGNGKVVGLEQCDTGSSKWSKGCTDCTVDKGYMCFGGSVTTRSTCMLQSEYTKQMVKRKIELQEAICKEKNAAFILNDLSSGDGECVPYPEVGEPLLSSIQIGGSPLSGSDISASQVGPMMLPPIFLESVAAEDGTQGADVTAVCRSTRRLICTADDKAVKGSFSKTCIVANKVHCHEVFLDARFCKSKDDLKGEITWRFGRDVCVFKSCITPASWTTPEGKMITPTTWCLSASEGSTLPVVKSAYTPPAEAEAGNTGRRLLQQPPSKDNKSWLRLAQGLDRKAAEARMKKNKKQGLRKEMAKELDAPSVMAWRANEIETKRRQKAAKEELDSSGGQPAYVDELRKANEAANKRIRALRTAAVDKARDTLKKLPVVEAMHESAVLNTAEKDAQQLVEKIETSQLALKETAHKESSFKKATAAELATKRKQSLGKIEERMHSARIGKTHDLIEKENVAAADAASTVLAKSVTTEQEALSVKSPWIKRVAEAKYAIAQQRQENDDLVAHLEVGLKKVASKSSHNIEEIRAEKQKAETLKQKINELNVGVQEKDAHISKLTSVKSDCVLSVWLEWGICDKTCDMGVQRRERKIEAEPKNGGAACGALEDTQPCFIKHCEKCGDSKVVGIEACDDGNLEPGDGCDEYCSIEPTWSCFGGSTASASTCEQCGNGVIVGTEECDDGNQVDDDGCSKDCLVQPGFVCTGTPSKCMSRDEYDKSLELESFKQKRHCRAAHHQEFMVTDPSTGAGECKPPPETEFEDTTVHVNELAVINGSAISGGAAAVTRIMSVLTDPVAIDSAVDTAGNRGAQPYAVCRSASKRMCQTNRLPDDKGLDRVCRLDADVTCVEVALDARFCGVEGNNVKGSIEKRQYDGRTNADGEVCVFKNCNVPATWTTPEGSPIDPNAWCFSVAAQTSSDILL